MHCYLGVDDGFFSLTMKKQIPHSKTVLVGVLSCPKRIKNIFVDWTFIDTLDASSRILNIIEKASSIEIVRAVFLDGITYAGFNIVDPFKLYKLTRIPIIAIFRYPLDLSKIAKALANHFPDWSYRFKVISYVYSNSIELRYKNGVSIRLFYIGMNLREVLQALQDTASLTPEPYPLRVADRIASSIGKFLYRAGLRTTDLMLKNVEF